MFGHKAFSLLEEINRSDHGIPPYRDALVREVCDEVNELCKSLRQVDESAPDGEKVRCDFTFHLLIFTLSFKIAQSVITSAILRNRQCLLAYVNRRNHMLMQMRWNMGAVIPEDTRYAHSFISAASVAPLVRGVARCLLFLPLLRQKLAPHEFTFFSEYDSMLSKYFRETKLDLTTDISPPASLLVRVRCLQDHPPIFTEWCGSITISKDMLVTMRHSDAEPLIRTGVVELMQ